MDTIEAIVAVQDGCQQQILAQEVAAAGSERRAAPPPGGDTPAKKKKTRRGKSKRKLTKAYLKGQWQQRRVMKNSKINRKNRKIVSQSKTHAPNNTNQFLMEVHMPDPEPTFQIPRAPSVRTRDSSFSVDSEDNYFYSLPEDEEDFLTKEFSSVYEDAHSERLANMPKAELMQEYLFLEAKVDALTKRLINRTPAAEAPSEQDDSANTVQHMVNKIKEQDEYIQQLQASNETLRLQNERLQQISNGPTISSADSESDSSSSSPSSGQPTSREEPSPANGHSLMNGFAYSPGSPGSPEYLVNGHLDREEAENLHVMVNGNGIHSSEMGHSPGECD